MDGRLSPAASLLRAPYGANNTEFCYQAKRLKAKPKNENTGNAKNQVKIIKTTSLSYK